jgi:hypothetical protein
MEIPDVELYDMLTALPRQAWVSSDLKKAWIALEDGLLVVVPFGLQHKTKDQVWATIRAIQDC